LILLSSIFPFQLRISLHFSPHEYEGL
jgi:hypothetical protein